MVARTIGGCCHVVAALYYLLKRLKNKEWRNKTSHPTSSDRFSKITDITEWAIQRKKFKKERKAARLAAVVAQGGVAPEASSDEDSNDSYNGDGDD